MAQEVLGVLTKLILLVQVLNRHLLQILVLPCLLKILTLPLDILHVLVKVHDILFLKKWDQTGLYGFAVVGGDLVDFHFFFGQEALFLMLSYV